MRYSLYSKSDENYTGIAVDTIGTHSREDCFQFTKNKDGTTFRVMVVIPPFEKVLEESLMLALKVQLLTCCPKNTIPIFEPQEKMRHSLQIGRQSKVLIAEYIFNTRQEFIKESLYMGTVYLTDQYTFESYARTPNANWHMIMLGEAVKGKQHLKNKLNSNFAKDIKWQNGLGCKFVFGALELFNHTCRNIARIHRIPFVSPPHHKQTLGFRVSEGYSRFNHGLRNPCSFINLANLIYFLSGKGIFLNREELLQYLPKK